MSQPFPVLSLVALLATLGLGGCESVPTQENVPEPKVDNGPETVTEFDRDRPSIIIGAVEKASFEEFDFPLEARIDTGATTSSIDARDIKPFERDGKEWVAFTIKDRESDASLRLKRPIERVAVIEQQGPKQRRYVARLSLVFNGQEPVFVEFTLTNRENYEYPVLIGRNVLEGKYMVDVSTEFALGKSLSQQ
ncbi:ATP-dependent zinc protease family protein [Pelagicoccus mobilis]|uniref:ATP-dependent zinc protease n=1 Tax=Pelagicoccus mobilis TaxID=415221 RepID=A0A934S0J8_9BACT|nr:RimK/LysX family protein [Pelagicoccus mobilis]MBK1878970.1 ATP-dependent zinc protease [Pelagicoccus mobilis]